MLSFTVWAAITIALSTRSHQAKHAFMARQFRRYLADDAVLVSLWMGVIVTTLSIKAHGLCP